MANGRRENVHDFESDIDNPTALDLFMIGDKTSYEENHAYHEA